MITVSAGFMFLIGGVIGFSVGIAVGVGYTVSTAMNRYDKVKEEEND